MTLEERLVQAGLDLGMTEVEARRAAADTISRQAWRLRRGGKECSSCHETKPVSEFGRNASRTDGLAHYCRRCRSV